MLDAQVLHENHLARASVRITSECQVAARWSVGFGQGADALLVVLVQVQLCRPSVQLGILHASMSNLVADPLAQVEQMFNIGWRREEHCVSWCLNFHGRVCPLGLEPVGSFRIERSDFETKRGGYDISFKMLHGCRAVPEGCRSKPTQMPCPRRETLKPLLSMHYDIVLRRLLQVFPDLPILPCHVALASGISTFAEDTFVKDVLAGYGVRVLCIDSDIIWRGAFECDNHTFKCGRFEHDSSTRGNLVRKAFRILRNGEESVAVELGYWCIKRAIWKLVSPPKGDAEVLEDDSVTTLQFNPVRGHCG